MTTYSIQLKTGEVIPSEEIKSACFLLWGLIGDVFVRVAILEAFKQAYPQASITAVVDPQGAAVLANHPDVDEVYVFSRSKKPRGRYAMNVLRGVTYLRRRHFDLCVNLYSGGSSPLLSRLFNARIRLGFDHTAALRKANNLLAAHPSLCKHWTRQLAVILAPLGIDPAAVRQGTSYYCDSAALAYADQLLAGDDRQYIVINLGARVKEKCWKLSNFVELAAGIYEKYQLCPLVLTNPGMEELAAAFRRQYGERGPIRILPLLPLNQVAAVMRHAKFVITGDTSIMHLSFGLKLPTLVLFTYTRPEIVAPADCVHQDCFVPNPTMYDECGKPVGSPDIPVAMALEKFDTLFLQISRS